MTTAGTITVGVDIDATGLGARLHNAISAQLAPVMAQLRTQTQGTGNDFGDLAHRAELSSARQVVALRRVVEQLHDVRNAALQAHAALNSLHGPGNNSVGPLGNGGNLTINRNTYNYDYRNYSVTNNTVNNSTTTIHNNSGGGGGGGGGGNNGNNRRGLFGGGGVGGFLTSPGGLGVLGLGANALPAATLAVTNLLGAVQQLAQTGFLLPAAFGAAASSIGTAVIGFKGMGEAITAINKGMEEGASKADLKKMADALKDMNGNAKEVALTVATDVLPAFKKIQQDVVQQNMFDGIAASITTLKDKAMPTFERGLGGIATAWNDTLKKGMSALGDDQNLSLLDRLFGNTAEGQKRANAAIAPITHAMAQLAATGSEFLPRLGDAIAKVMTRFDNFISKNAANGNLWRWIDEGLNGMRALGNSILNIGKILAGITKAAGGLTGSLSGDGGFLGGMEKLTGQWADFINSAEGQEKLGNFFKEAKERLGEWIPILGNVAKVIGDVFEGLQQWGDVLLPILSKVTSALASMPGLITAAVTAFAGFKTLGWLAGLLGVGGGAGAGAGAGAAGGLLGLLRGPLGVGLAGAGLFTGGVMSSAGPDGPGWGSSLSTIGGGALLGGAIGSVIPVVGTALGAAIGAGAGAITVGVQALVASMGNVDKPLNDLTDSIRAAAAENWKNIKNQTGLQDDPTPGVNPGQSFTGPRPVDAFVAIGKDGLPIMPDPNMPNDLGRLGQGQIDNPLSRTGIPGWDSGFPLDKDGRPLVRTDNTGRPEASGGQDFTGGFAPVPTPSSPLPVAVVNDPFSGISPPGLPGNSLAPKDLGSLLSDTPPPSLFPRPAGPGPAYQPTPAAPPMVQGPGLPNNWPGGGGPQAPLPPVKADTTAAQGDIDKLASSIQQLPKGEVAIKSDDIPRVKTDLDKLNTQITDVSKNEIVVKANDDQAKRVIDSLIQSYQGRSITLNVTAGGVPAGPPRADGGVLPGYSPGADNMLVPMSGGEGVVIPEAMRALGGSWLYGINSRFRSGLSRRGYATGGVVGADGALGAPDNSVIGLLTQIRDALVGRGSSALATTADNTTQMAQALGPKAKPFGGDVGKGALAGAIKALGGDPNLMDWGGYSGDGQLLVPKAGFNAAGLSAGVPPGVAAALQAFARSGNTADLGGGLSVTDPVVRAIVTARNKKTGLSDDQIAGLVGQVLGGGGFQGVLDPTNTPLVNALTAYQNKANRPVRGSAPVAAGTGVGLTPLGGFDAALLSQVPAGQYSQTGAADLTKGLADCSSSVEDLVNLMDGMPTGGREMSTGNASDWLTSRGFVPAPGVVPGAFNVAFNSGHMQATLPDGTPFNWGSDSAAARGGVGGTGAADPSLNQHYYRPVTGMPPGAGLSMGMSANPLGYSGGPVPVYIVDGPSASFGKQLAGQVAGDALSAMGQPLSDVAGSIITGIDQGTQLERDSTKNRPATPTSQLMKEGNPLSVAALAGYKVPDFSRKGWSGPVNTNAGPGFTAGGQMISDTSAIIQRSFADMEAANDARQQQLLAVLDAIKTQLSEQVLKPIIQSAVTAAMQAAGSGAAAGSMQVPGLAGGGGITGGVAGKDSVPALLMPGEHVFTTDDVARMGGQSGVYAFRRALYANGGAVRHFATGGGVNVNKTVGADFFGVGQVPIIGPLINLLINILLQVIGVNIEAADTLNEISSSFNQFRGDFKRFDATGRVTADTSALSDRSGSSKEKAVDERVRIFKEVLTGLIKFIIQKIIIPITQAVMQTLLSTASSAVSGAITGGIGAAGGGPAGAIVGNLVGGLMNSAGGAAINIGGELISQLVSAATGPIVDLITGGLMDLFGGLLSPILSGGIGGLVSMFLPFLAFDSGGVASGKGLLPKATVEPERVLSPRQTSLFEEMVRANFGSGSTDSSRHVKAEIHLHGSQATAEEVRNSLLTLMS